MLSSLLRSSSCRALAAGCSGAAALAGTRVNSVLGRRHYLAPSLLAGLGAYGENFGHVRVPNAFVVPDADGWPVEARGPKLGLQVSSLRTQKKRDTLPQDDVAQLDALRFGPSKRIYKRVFTGPFPLSAFDDDSVQIVSSSGRNVRQTRSG